LWGEQETELKAAENK